MTSPIPCPWQVGVRAWAPAGRDRHGNPAPGWAPPVPVPVHAVAPRVSEQTEPGDANRHAVVDGLILYCPPGTVIGARDRVEWDGQTWEVDGPAADYSRGPWHNPAGGVVAELRRVEG